MTPTPIGFAILVAAVLATGETGVLATGEADHTYTTFSRCTPAGTPLDRNSVTGAPLIDGYVIKSFSAELKLDAHVDNYTGHYNYVSVGTSSGISPTDGHTRLEVSVEVLKDGRSMPDTTINHVKARVHEDSCEVNKGKPPLYKYNSLEPSSGSNILEIPLPFDGATDGTPNVAEGSVTRAWLADYDRAGSVVLYEPQGAPFACCDLVPNLPNLPDTWSATIEANFVQNASQISYTMLRKEWYHKASNNLRIDEHSAYSKQTRLINVDYDKMIILHQNTTFPDGHCEDHDLSAAFSGFLTRGGKSHSLQSTAEMYAFKGTSPDVYSPVKEYVRGIKCEKWTRQATITGRSGTNHSYTYEYYFPVSSWMIRRESYHRMLSRVVIKSTKGFRGGPVVHYYDFVDMVPYINDMDVFNPCDVFAGKPLSGNCTCGLPGTLAPAPWASNSGGGDSKAKQQGEMAAVAIVCLFLGALASFGGTFVYFTKCGGIERQTTTHKLFTEGTQMSTI